MLTHAHLMSHMGVNAITDGGVPYPYEGRPDGMASDLEFYSPLSIEQGIVSNFLKSSAPKTMVNPTHEQGFGRSPGWREGWMRKNIPFSRSVIAHQTHRMGQIRVEGFLASGEHAPGRGKWQYGKSTRTPQRGTIPDPTSVYLTAGVPPADSFSSAVGPMSWGEPV